MAKVLGINLIIDGFQDTKSSFALSVILSGSPEDHISVGKRPGESLFDSYQLPILGKLLEHSTFSNVGHPRFEKVIL